MVCGAFNDNFNQVISSTKLYTSPHLVHISLFTSLFFPLITKDRCLWRVFRFFHNELIPVLTLTPTLPTSFVLFFNHTMNIMHNSHKFSLKFPDTFTRDTIWPRFSRAQVVLNRLFVEMYSVTSFVRKLLHFLLRDRIGPESCVKNSKFWNT